MPDFEPHCRCPGCGTCSASKEKALAAEELNKLKAADFAKIEQICLAASGNQAFIDAREFVNAAKTPEARQARKQALFLQLYGTAPKETLRGRR